MTDSTNQAQDKQSMSALKQHGSTILTIILVVLAAYFGWQYYQNNYGKIDTVAADAYTSISSRNDQMLAVAQNPQADDAAKKQLADDETKLFADIDALVKEHGDTAYAWQALMIKANHQVEKNELKSAIETLKQAVAIDLGDEGLISIAKIRLARTLLADGDVEQAAALANETMPTAFEPSRQELLGDIAVAKNDVEAAKTAYTAAWEALRTRQENRAVLSLKLQSLGVMVEPIAPKAAIVTEPKQAEQAVGQTTIEEPAAADKNKQTN